MLNGENGIITQVQKSREETKKGEEKEQLTMAYTSAAINKSGDIVTSSDFQYELDLLTGNEKTLVTATSNSTFHVLFYETNHNYFVDNGKISSAEALPPYTTYTDINGETAPIPKGFNVSTHPDEQVIETGLVIKDAKQNEWVWVPVDDINEWVVKNVDSETGNITYTSKLYRFTSSGKT